MKTLLQHTKSELRAAGLFDADADFNGDIAVNVVALMETFLAYGHSGMSGVVTLDIFNRVANGLPLTPLTGEDDEWEPVPGDTTDQMQVNRRCNRVFKDSEKAFDAARGHKPITFPYAPD